ncbi:MAG: hypothetical protein JJ958_12310 [Balneola sp.]|nr:hypothetical protein [Balneola sp.]
MKKTSLLLSLLLFLSVNLRAQETAIMTVSVKVISGVKAEKISDLYLTNDSSGIEDSEVIVSSAPHSDVLISVEENSTLTNSLGETFQIETDSLITSDASSGTSLVSISGSLPENKELSGRYTGMVTTTIIYL